MGIAHIKGESAGYLKCEVVIDASVEECAAYNFIYMSRKRMRINDKKAILRREIKHTNDHSFDSLLLKDFGFGLTPRVMLLRNIWKRVGVRIIHAVENVHESQLFKIGEGNKSIQVKTVGIYSYSPVDNGKSTKMIYIAQVNLGGIIPSAMINLSAVGVLSDHEVMRKNFNLTYKIDLERRELLMEKLRGSTVRHSKLEKDHVERGRNFFRTFQNSEGGKLAVKTDNELVKALVIKSYCKLSATIRCGRLEALAFLLSVER